MHESLCIKFLHFYHVFFIHSLTFVNRNYCIFLYKRHNLVLLGFFRATFVDNQGNFWLREESEPIVQIGGPPLDPSIVRQNVRTPEQGKSKQVI